MKHWSVKSQKYAKTNPKAYQIWHTINQINNGLTENETLNSKIIFEEWDTIKPELDPYKARAVEYLLWGKRSSLPTNLNFWSWLGKSQT